MISENLSAALQIMGLGMAGIFVFMLLFWVIIIVLHRAIPGKRDEQQGTEEASERPGARN